MSLFNKILGRFGGGAEGPGAAPGDSCTLVPVMSRSSDTAACTFCTNATRCS